jgi:hypothetical protein
MIWKLLAVLEGVVIAVLLTVLVLGRDKFVHLGNNAGESTYLLADTRTGQVCYGGPKVAYVPPTKPVTDSKVFDKPNPGDVAIEKAQKDDFEKSYRGTGLPYCVDLH